MTPRRDGPASVKSDIRLVALLDGHQVGDVHETPSGALRFVYTSEWRDNADAYPLSLSLPLTAQEHGHEPITAFLWGLLPDTGRTLDHYARLFGVSAGSPVALLSHLGADCAGAVQLAAPPNVERLLGAAPRRPAVEWLTEAEVARELRTVRTLGVPALTRDAVGQFSLAGAQPKIALLEDNGRWGRPLGRTPTNRILKPPAVDLAAFAENEHFCLELAGELGLGAVGSRVGRFGDEIAIVVDRFDRARIGGTLRRIHQEDVCQALAVMPTRKYESEGGPGVADIVRLLRESSRRPGEDIDRFLRATILTWVLAAPDAHAKNYALLHGPGGGVRLAPFYDIATYLPYADPALHRVKLAMKIGGEYLVRRIGRARWEAVAKSAGIGSAVLLDTIDELLTRLPAAIAIVSDRATHEGLQARAISRLARCLRARVTECAEAMRRR